MDQLAQQDSRSGGQQATPVTFKPRLVERTHNLPSQISSLVGRAEAIGALRRLLASTRLLTLTGPGGIGKTRLALAVGEAVLPDYEDGVWLVELASLAEPALVLPAVAGVLGVRAGGGPLLEHLAEVLRSSVTLLLLDNCEHLARRCAELSDHLLHACPDLRIIATSRERLNVRGEVVWRVPGLSVPEVVIVQNGLAQANTNAAVELFVQRARTASGFSLTAQNSAAVADVSRKLDGIPLAIELAAGRTNVLTPQEIADRVGDLIAILVGGSRTSPSRQQTMRATLDWSYGLLSPSERTLFSRLSVFAGGWTLDAAEAICADPEPSGPIHTAQVLELTGRLVDQSLVVAEATESSAMRYRMLEPVRQYARDQLRTLSEEADLRARHRTWFLSMAETAWPALRGPDQRAWLSRLEHDHDNLRSALESSLQHATDAVPALRLAGALHWFWWRRGYASEGRGWLARALELDARLGASAEPSVQSARLRALKGAGLLAYAQGEFAAAAEIMERVLSIAEALEDPAATADAAYWVAVTRFYLGRREGGRELLERSVVLWRQVGDPWGMAWPLASQAGAAYWRGDYALATALAQERLRLARASQDPWMIGNACVQLGVFAYEQNQHELATEWLDAGRRAFGELSDDSFDAAHLFCWSARAARSRGDCSEALRSFAHSLLLHQRLGQKWGIVECLEGVAGVLFDLLQCEAAARLFGSAGALRERLGFQAPSRDAVRQEQELSAVRAMLGEVRFESATSKGQRLEIDEAIADALAMVSSHADHPPSSHAVKDSDPLAPRELEVAKLVSTGRSNREIADALVIAASTAERHVANILSKLGLRSRTQLAVWVHQQDAH